MLSGGACIVLVRTALTSRHGPGTEAVSCYDTNCATPSPETKSRHSGVPPAAPGQFKAVPSADVNCVVPSSGTSSCWPPRKCTAGGSREFSRASEVRKLYLFWTQALRSM